MTIVRRSRSSLPINLCFVKMSKKKKSQNNSPASLNKQQAADMPAVTDLTIEPPVAIAPPAVVVVDTPAVTTTAIVKKEDPVETATKPIEKPTAVPLKADASKPIQTAKSIPQLPAQQPQQSVKEVPEKLRFDQRPILTSFAPPLSSATSSIMSQPAASPVVDYALLTKTLLAHLYSSNGVYQNRALDAFYHPVYSSYSDPLLRIGTGRESIRQLFRLYFQWFTEEMLVDVHSITVGPSSGHIFTLPSGLTTIRKPGKLVVADYTVRIQSYTWLGMVLHWFGLLPPLVYFAYAPLYGEKQTSPYPGLRVMSKFHWLEESVANGATAPTTPGIGGGPSPTSTSTSVGRMGNYVVSHEDMYSWGSIVNYFLAIPVMLVSMLMDTLWSLVFFVVPPSMLLKVKQSWSQGSLATAAKKQESVLLWKSSPSPTDSYVKEPLGRLLTEGVMKGVDRITSESRGSAGPTADVRARLRETSKAGR